MIVKLLTEHHLEFLSLIEGCKGTCQNATLLEITCHGSFQAKLTYEDATERGFTAMLLKEDDSAGDIFQCYLGNLPPKTNAKLSFAYALELPQEPDGKVRFTLPTVLNPRYSSGIT